MILPAHTIFSLYYQEKFPENQKQNKNPKYGKVLGVLVLIKYEKEMPRIFCIRNVLKKYAWPVGEVRRVKLKTLRLSGCPREELPDDSAQDTAR